MGKYIRNETDMGQRVSSIRACRDKERGRELRTTEYAGETPFRISEYRRRINLVVWAEMMEVVIEPA